MNSSSDELKTIILAALLHDIGKFWQRTGEKGDHSELGARFIEEHSDQFPHDWLDDLCDAIGNHHKSFARPIEEVKPIEKTTKLADRLASGERKDNLTLPRLDPDKSPLIPTFNFIKLKSSKPSKLWGKRLEPFSLEPSSVFPVPIEEADVNPHNYKEKLWNPFVAEFERLGEINSSAKITTLIFLLQKYTSCFPSATPWEKEEEYRTLPDISLFHHLKATSAIASCLCRLPDSQIEGLLQGSPEESKKPICQVIRADISGIQPFIYRITEPVEGTRKGTARRLRGRSLYLSILLEVIAHWLIRSLNLTIANILFCGGGRFDLLVPIDPDTQNRLTTLIGELNEWLLKEFHGELGIQIVREEAYRSDFNDMERVYENLEDKLKEAKQVKFRTMLDDESFFSPEEKLYDVCDVCNLEPLPERRTCDMCKKHAEIGKIAPHIDTVAYIWGKYEQTRKDIEVIPFERFDTSVILLPSQQEKEVLSQCELQEKSGIFHKINSTNFLQDSITAKISFGFKFLANEAPTAKEQIGEGEEAIEEKEVLSFDKIAEMSKGTKLLGIFKADVDYLGSIFSIGIEPKKTISRISSLSDNLDLFFSGYLNRICKDIAQNWHSDPSNQSPLKGKVDGLFYIVYSGGDDLFIIGPWDQSLELAQRLNSEFRKYACRNDNLTLSSAILLVKPHFPIQRFSQLVNQKLRLSKSDADKKDKIKPYEKNRKPYEKNRITVFNETVVWQDTTQSFEELFTFGKDLVRYVEENQVPRTFIHFLLRLYNQYLEENREEKPLWTPKFFYALARRVEDAEVKAKLIERVPILIKHIRLPLWYASLITRKEV